MNCLRAAASAAILSLGIGTASDANAKDAEINALWNDKDGFGIWITEVSRSCAEGYTAVKPLIVISPALKADRNPKPQTLDLRTMKMCLYFSAKSPLPEKCSSGTVTYRYDTERNQYVGELSVQLRVGQEVRQHFRAEYCKSSS